jgi:hypothetical protein
MWGKSIGKVKNAHRILVRKSEFTGPLGRPGLNGRITLGWISEKQAGFLWTGFFWLRIGTTGRLF